MLLNSGDKLQVVTSAALNTDAYVAWGDGSAAVPSGRSNKAISTAATTDLFDGSGAQGKAVQMALVSIRNKDASSSQGVTVQLSDGTTVVELKKVTLLAGECLQYTPDMGFRVFDTNGYEKTSAQALTVVKTLAADVTNATTTPALTNLQSGSLQPGTYQFSTHVIYQAGATTTGINLSLDFTGTVTSFVANEYWVDANALAATGAPTQSMAAATGGVVAAMAARAKSQAGFGTTASVDSANADCLMVIEGTMVVTGAGSLNLWHASEVAAATTVKVGSNMIVTKVG